MLSSGYSAFLPLPLTTLVGREREIAGIAGLLDRDDVRLVTLIGPGGVGKTRTAVAVAREIAGRFQHGALFVDLTPIVEVNRVAPAIAHALAMPETGKTPVEEQLISFLRDQNVLLVLDNFEQVVEAAPLVAHLLGFCPDVRVLATSRVPLKLSGEHEYAILPLGLIDDEAGESLDGITQSDAVRLFVERAQGVTPDFTLSMETAPLVAEICRRLDGLPLAIELAAARTKVLPPAALLSRLEVRLPLLVGGNRDRPDRQRTMRDTIAWSYDLLPPDEQTLFRRLSVFVGGFSLEAAAEVVEGGDGGRGGNENAIPPHPHQPSVPPVLDGIASLVDKSLLRQAAGPEPRGCPEPRYGMLETIREYGLERLATAGEEDDVRLSHAAWGLDLAEWARARSFSGHRWSVPTVEPTSLRLVEADHDNIRAALTWLERSRDASGLLRLASAMSGFWFLRGHRRDGRYWLERALTVARADGTRTEARARALIGAGMLARSQGDYDRANAFANEYLVIALESGDPWREDEARWLLGYVALAKGEYTEAIFQLERALALLDPVSDLVDMADGHSMLAMAAYGTGDLARAAELQANVLETFRRVDDPYRSVVSLTYLGMIACDLGDCGESASRYAEALPILQAIGWREMLAEWLAGVATLASARGAMEDAAQYIGAAEALRTDLGHAFTLPERSVFERGIETARRALGEPAFAAATRAGGEMPLERAVTKAAHVLQIAIADPAPVRLPDVAAVAGLTPREAEVVRMIAAGLSNAEIADTLYISVPTVKRHLTNILGKLELPSRSALNTWAHTHGLA